MIEILSWKQADELPDSSFKIYLQEMRTRTQQEPWDFINWGYWVIIEDFSVLHQTIVGTYFTLPSVENGLFDILELVEEKFGVYELVFLLDTDFGISLLMAVENMPEAYRSILNGQIK